MTAVRTPIYRPEIGKAYVRKGKIRVVVGITRNKIQWRLPRGTAINESTFIGWVHWMQPHQAPKKKKKKAPRVRSRVTPAPCRPGQVLTLAYLQGEITDDDIPF